MGCLGPGAVHGMSLSGFSRRLREFGTPFVAVRVVPVSSSKARRTTNRPDWETSTQSSQHARRKGANSWANLHSARCWARCVRSTGQALTRHGKSDDETFRLPIARDFSSKLARHGRANKKIAESVDCR